MKRPAVLYGIYGMTGLFCIAQSRNLLPDFIGLENLPEKKTFCIGKCGKTEYTSQYQNEKSSVDGIHAQEDNRDIQQEQKEKTEVLCCNHVQNVHQNLFLSEAKSCQNRKVIQETDCKNYQKNGGQRPQKDGEKSGHTGGNGKIGT